MNLFSPFHNRTVEIFRTLSMLHLIFFIVYQSDHVIQSFIKEHLLISVILMTLYIVECSAEDVLYETFIDILFFFFVFRFKEIVGI